MISNFTCVPVVFVSALSNLYTMGDEPLALVVFIIVCYASGKVTSDIFPLMLDS